MSRSTPRKANAPHAPPSAAQTPSGERPAKGRTGRPSLYTDELAAKICAALATSRYGLARVCDENREFPHPATIMRWLDIEENARFRENYARSCARRADTLFEEMLDIADDCSGDPERADNGKETQHATEQVARSKLRVDTRKWMIAKMAPKKYGESLKLVGAGPDEDPVRVELSARDRAKALAALVAKQRDTG